MDSRRFCIFVLATLTLAFSANAQVNTGAITGAVHDASGAMIPNATVTAKSVETGATRTVQTGNIGQFVIQALTPGNYKVDISSPNFKTFETTVEVTVGGNATLDAALEVGSSSVVVEVIGGGGTEVNTETQELSQLVDSNQLGQLPSLNRNPYDFVVLSGNVSNGDNTTASMNSSQTLSSRGVGYAINGQRMAGTEILLDGVENVAVFGVAPGQLIPQDSVQEFSILTNNFGAEYGRASGGVVNVDTKPGTNGIHGSLFEYNRLAAYTANTFANVITDTPKGQYTRNQFGWNIGAPIVKDKLFVSFSEELIRVRSAAVETEDVFDPAFISLLPSNMQSYWSKYATGVLPSKVAATAGQLVSSGLFVSPSNPTGAFPLINGTGVVPASTPVFDTVTFNAPFDAGGGVPENTNNIVGRLDYTLNTRTQMFFRYGWYRETDLPGSSGYSPYPQYDVGDYNDDDSALFSVNHSFASNVLSSSKVSFTRFNVANSFNTSLTGTPNLFLNTTEAQSTDPVTGNIIQLPGLQNSTTGTGGLPFGGPQNTLQVGEDLAWTKGRHNMRFGGDFTYIQLNVAYGAYAQAVEALGPLLPASFNSLVNTGGVQQDGVFATPLVQFTGRVSAEGALPCDTNIYGEPIVTPSCTVTPPLPAASYARSYRYKDWDLFAMDSFRITRRLTINYGLRYEHYGVQHNNKQDLDSNFYPGAGDFAESIRTGQVMVTQKSPIGQFWQNRWGTAAPRVGFAYDVTGDGKTALRGGFGISYERNFGNVTYNASFNPPASAVINDNCNVNSAGIIGTSCSVFVGNSSLGPLGEPGPPAALSPVELRDNQYNINVAQTQFWGMVAERQIVPNTLVSISYSGAHGVHLYDIANINLAGSGQFYLNDPLVTGVNPVDGTPCPWTNPVTNAPTCYTRLNSAYTNINRRGSDGVSSYNGLNVKFQTQNLHHTGISLIANYTFSHSLDDLSDTFSGSESAASLGYTSVTHPQLDYGSSDFDIRHRVVLSPVWETPWFKTGRGFLTQAAGGWTVSGIFTIRTGIPFSVYDLTDLINYYTIPRLTPSTTISQWDVGKAVQSAPNVNQFVALNVPAAAMIGPLDPALGISDFGPYPANMTGRNAFRGPGAWSGDMAVQKNFRLTERFGLQFRAEGFDLFNHHNYYVNTEDNYTVQGGGPVQIIEEKGGLGNGATGGNHDERRFGQFSLRFTF